MTKKEEGKVPKKEEGKAKEQAPTNIQTVKMEDGRIVDFVGKRKMLKGSEETDDGQVKVTIDFRNGATRSVIIPDSLIKKSAAHGMEQKLGDSAAGEKDVADAVLAVEAVITQIEKGEWSAQRSSSGMSGTSVLLKALVRYSGKPPVEVKTFLMGKDQKEKLALRRNSAIAPIIAEIEAEKGGKEDTVDAEAMLSELG